jgi:hypothetical protein
MAQTETNVKSRKEKTMNKFEEILLAALQAAPAIVPIFVSSPKAVAVANVSEEFVQAFMQAQSAKAAAQAAAPAA